MTRAEFSKRTKLQAFDRAKGQCEVCGAKLFTGNIEYDHRIPCAFGGEPTLENCMVCCRNCHGEKTHKSDVPAVAKSNRVRARHLGIRSSRQSFPTNRDGKWKKKMSGDVVRR